MNVGIDKYIVTHSYEYYNCISFLFNQLWMYSNKYKTRGDKIKIITPCNLQQKLIACTNTWLGVNEEEKWAN